VSDLTGDVETEVNIETKGHLETSGSTYARPSDGEVERTVEEMTEHEIYSFGKDLVVAAETRSRSTFETSAEASRQDSMHRKLGDVENAIPNSTGLTPEGGTSPQVEAAMNIGAQAESQSENGESEAANNATESSRTAQQEKEEDEQQVAIETVSGPAFQPADEHEVRRADRSEEPTNTILTARITEVTPVTDAAGTSESRSSKEMDSATVGTFEAPDWTPRQFRPVARVPTKAASPATRGAPRGRAASNNRSLPIDLRLRFEKAGFCKVSLMPRRGPGMPDAISVSGSGMPPDLNALQDDWYQDVFLADCGRMLREGIEWSGANADERHLRWSLSGREIFVLAHHDSLSGFVNRPRLVLGDDQIVLCTVELLPEVLNMVALTGSPLPFLLDADSGIPAGWIALRGVVPRVPIASSTEVSIFDTLRPLADLEIRLVGGIRIERQTWLHGFPPSICIMGDAAQIGSVFIDDCQADGSPDGGYVTPGWDSIGDHRVWCATESKTYHIRAGVEDWEGWDAYVLSLGENGRSSGSVSAICGAFVRPPRSARSDSRAFIVPASNPILLGANPGEIVVCYLRADVHLKQCIGFPWFDPVWAVPADPPHCDRASARILFLGATTPSAYRVGRTDKTASPRRIRLTDSGVRSWCSTVQTAGKKRLSIEPNDPPLVDLWTTYKRRAKALWRTRR